ncbi:hypothetical protein COW99_05720 [Candidatus Roizmanbacteria bacterium CG22_combo_CG10-13_8_21_14_all_38_20]|uniref:Uncharacterized protein n=1 Tax=Candidatus Roizmanbacteria bacterium CG22_combo_CG10-13_8_21_14_all_38_20 TaxID=1974862 RepID=A0A2H0BU09_9BACT|nr:MAG: hypothetical protein COW99_05720 [Candidatus Roizmanbacteria bacterium CG22_combo_CG10-13_8_21_14_all_38_20]PJC32407.1 MAG: hypothetical protein CO050_00030 [Candidatus Roizmanbacteria bacterium CG_4_9_14_0_2_um_filter_38_17]
MDNQEQQPQKRSLIDGLWSTGVNINRGLNAARAIRATSVTARAVPFLLSPAGIAVVVVIVVLLLLVIIPMLLMSGSAGITGAGPYELQRGAL